MVSGAQSLSSLTPVAPTDPALTSVRAALNAARWPAAEQQLRAYLKDRPASSEALYLLGATLFHEDKPKESLEVYTRAAALQHPSATDLHTVALDYVLLGDYADADKWMSESIREGATDADAWYSLGRIKYNENRFAEAIASFGKALELSPRLVKAEDNLGLSYEGLNQPDKAMEAYRQAIAWGTASGKPSEQPLLNLGTLLADRNQLEEALPLLLQAEAIAPAYGKTHAALGKLYARKGSLPEAERELTLAVTADPKNSGLHFQLGQVYRKLGKPDQATAELTTAATLEREQRHQ